MGGIVIKFIWQIIWYLVVIDAFIDQFLDIVGCPFVFRIYLAVQGCRLFAVKNNRESMNTSQLVTSHQPVDLPLRYIDTCEVTDRAGFMSL